MTDEFTCEDFACLRSPEARLLTVAELELELPVPWPACLTFSELSAAGLLAAAALADEPPDTGFSSAAAVAGVGLAAADLLGTTSSASWSEGFDPSASPSLSSRTERLTTSRSSARAALVRAGTALVASAGAVAAAGTVAVTVAPMPGARCVDFDAVTTVGIWEACGARAACATAKPTAPTSRTAATIAADRVAR